MTVASVSKIGPWLAAGIVAGNMIGSGIFLLPAVLANVGAGSILGWFFAAISAAILACVYGVLATRRPPQESLIDYPKKVFHPAIGFIGWLAYWSACWIGNIAILLASVGYLLALFSLNVDRLTETGMLIVAIWATALINLVGPRFLARFSAATLIIGLLPIIAAILIGVFRFDFELFQASWNVSGKPLLEATPPIMLTVFWAFLGLESANAISGVVKNPQTNVPLAAVAGTVFAALIYALASTALFGLISIEALQQSSAPFADAIAVAAGPIAGMTIAAAAFSRTFGCAGSWLLVSAEANHAAITHGYFPAFLALRLKSENRNRDIIMVSILMTILSIATISPTLNEQFILIVDITVLTFLLVYTLSSLSLIRFAQHFENRQQKRNAIAIGALGAFASIAIAIGYFAF